MKSIKTLTLFSFLIFATACAYFGFGEQRVEKTKTFEIDNAKKFIALNKYDEAEKNLIIARNKNATDFDPNEKREILLLLGQVYDQSAQPEKAILNLQEYADNPDDDQINQAKANAFLIKNYLKEKYPKNKKEYSVLKEKLRKIVFAVSDKKTFIEGLRSTLDFNCDQYCLEEISYLKEIQVYYFYAAEGDADNLQRVSDILISRYDFFESYVDSKLYDKELKKNIALSLFDSIQKAKLVYLDNNNVNSVLIGQIIVKLDRLQNKLEHWLYGKDTK